MASTSRASKHRCVAHLDLDAFYCQVERALLPRGRHGDDAPLVVVQYNPFERGGVREMRASDDRELRDGFENHSLIAVSYEAVCWKASRASWRRSSEGTLPPDCAMAVSRRSY